MKLKRMICLVLMLFVAAALMSMTAGIALAEADGPEEIQALANDAPDADSFEASENGEVAQPVDDAVEIADEFDIGDDEPETLGDADAVPEETEAMLGEAGYADDVTAFAGSFIDSFPQALVANGNPAVSHSVNIAQNGTTVSVQGSIADPFILYGLFVDDKLVAPVSGASVDQAIDMNAFDTGYHTVWLAVVNKADTKTVVDVIYQNWIVSNTITDAPTYTGAIEVFDTYFNFYPYDMYLQNQKGDLYLEYSSDGGITWNRSGYMRANLIKLFIQQGYCIDGLAPNTAYMTRLRYGGFVTYSKDWMGDGESHFFGGPVLNTYTIRTGAATAPLIKSVTIKAVKVRHHRVRHPGYYNIVGGVAFWHKAYTERFYTCKLRVTVKLKKKPGTNGLWISVAGQSKYVPGNRKKYTATFTPYPNYFARRPRGHYKYTATIRSGQDANWGGYSPAVNRKRKLK